MNLHTSFIHNNQTQETTQICQMVMEKQIALYIYTINYYSELERKELLI